MIAPHIVNIQSWSSCTKLENPIKHGKILMIRNNIYATGCRMAYDQHPRLTQDNWKNYVQQRPRERKRMIWINSVKRMLWSAGVWNVVKGQGTEKTDFYLFCGYPFHNINRITLYYRRVKIYSNYETGSQHSAAYKTM